MTEVRIEITQERSVVAGPLYRTKTTVTYNTGIDRSIFLFSTEDDSFQHVATPYDMETYPNSKAEAVTEGAEFYRLTEDTSDFDTTTTAIEFASYTRSRVALLVQEYKLVTDSFEGSGSYIYSKV